MNAKQHLEKLSGYGKQIEAIEQDSRYSTSYRETLRQAVRAEMEKQVEAIPGDLAIEYKAARAQFDKAEQALQQARNAWREGWDYARMNYVTESVRATVNAALDMSDIETAYKGAHGDKYQIRAWHEVGASLAHSRFGVDAAQFVSNATRAGEALSNTPEVAKAEAAGAAVVKSLMQLQKDTFSIAGTINAAGFAFKSYKVEELGKTIIVGHKWEGEGVRYSVHFADESPAPAKSVMPGSAEAEQAATTGEASAPAAV